MANGPSDNFRAFIWNDASSGLENWRKIAEEAGCRVEGVSSKNVDTVLARFERSEFEIVVLDLLVRNKVKTQQRLGIEIAREIRHRDSFVPIVMVTRDPAQAYEFESEWSALNLCGPWHDSVMFKRGSCRDHVLWSSISRNHERFPDYALANSLSAALEHSPIKDRYGPELQGLLRSLDFLPREASMERWHEEFCNTLAEALKKAGWKRLAGQFGRLAAIFRDGDSFFMAARSSRRHLSHTVQVAMLGALFLLKTECIRKSAVNDLIKRGIAGDEAEALYLALLIWLTAATTHDIAYLAEKLDKVLERLGGAAAGLGVTIPRVPPKEWVRTHHAFLGGRLWQDAAELSKITADEPEGKIVSLIANMILRHDSKRDGDEVSLPVVQLENNEWIEFLGVLCDELQDWMRERLDTENEHHQLWLNRVEFDRDPENHERARFFFLIRPRSDADAMLYTADGLIRVEDRFTDTLDKLKRNLQSGVGLAIQLNALPPELKLAGGTANVRTAFEEDTI